MIDEKFEHIAEIVDTKVLAQVGRFVFKQVDVVRQLFGNGEIEPLPYRPVIFDRGDAAAVLLYDSTRRVVILSYQFRPAALERPSLSNNGWIIEIVAGMIEKDEDGRTTIKRETLEEIGYELNALTHVSDFFVSPGGTSEVIYLYAADVTSKNRISDGGGIVAEGEDILRLEMTFQEAIRRMQPAEIPIEQAFEMIRDGRIVDAKTIIALQWLRHKLSI